MITHFRQAIEETLPWLSSFGADPTGGMTRLLYSPEWLETQQQFKKRMAASGLETRFDEVGNLYGRLSGTEYPQEVVLSGSHIDTVVNGGNLDGQFGALAAWLAIDWLKTQYGAPLRTVEVVAMAEEEGSRFPYVFWGSKNIFGLANPDDVRNICDAKGNSFVDAMKACGFTLPNAPLTPRQDIKAFVELHIEQGCVLESNGQSIGVVNAIVGQRRYTVNVVPGKTTFTIDCRHTDAAVLRDFTQQLENDMRAICDEMDIGIDIDLWMDEEPVPMNKELVATLTELCESEKLNYRVMHSGAGHDAQIFAPRVPTCMIFIPSINGISHNPAERTNITDLAEGVKTLALMLYQLAWQK
ncbi:hydantoinase/carbamoylase family amidase [Escherichia coli]|nr:hydantoinase/carbamoylase family amidase [Escherichia coli]